MGCSSWLVESQRFPASLHGIYNRRCYLLAPRCFRINRRSAASDGKTNSACPARSPDLMGGLCGACLYAASNQPLVIGAILGAVGGVIGAFAGYEIRRRLVAALHVKDIFVALLEDLVAIGLACFFVSR